MSDPSRVYGAGALFSFAPYGTTPPATTAAAIDAAYRDCGVTSDDGIEEAFEAKADVIARRHDGTPYIFGSKETTTTFKVTLLDALNPNAHELYTGTPAQAAVGGGSTIAVGKPDITPKAMLIQLVDSNGSAKWYDLPKAVVTDRGKVSNKNDKATAYELTITAAYDTAAGYSHRIILDTDVSYPHVPGAPTGIVVTPASTTASVVFAAPAFTGGTLTNYKYSLNGGSTWTTRSPAAITSPLSITGLTTATTYNLKLRAVNATGDGDESATVAFTTT